MKARFDRLALLNAFGQVASVVPSRGTKEILQFVQLESSPETGVALSATDLDVGVRMEVSEVELLEAGRVLVPVSRFGNLLRESMDEFVVLESTTQGLTVCGDRFEVQLMAADPSEYPEVPVFDADQYHEVSAALMQDLIRRTVFATDQETTRYAFGGILLEMDETKIIGVGTDGRRLAKMEGPAQSVNGHATEPGTTVVPSRAMTVVERSLHEQEGTVLLAVRDNIILLRAGRLSMFARLVSGRFPDWRDVVPKEALPIQIELPVGPTQAAVRQASIVTTKESRGLDFRFSEGNLSLSATSAETGRSFVELPIAYDGPELSFCLDHRYVLEFLRVLDPAKQFSLQAQGSDHAVLFRTDDGYDYVVMPMARSASDET